jgi:gluconolactonase
MVARRDIGNRRGVILRGVARQKLGSRALGRLTPALLIAGILCGSMQVAASEIPAPSGEGIVPPSAQLELLFTRSAPIQGGLTEGPAVAPDGSIYFSDIPFGNDRGMILRFDPSTGKTTVFIEDSRKSNGLMFDAAGFLWACEGADGGGRAIARWNVENGERQVLTDNYQGRRLNSPNDLCFDRAGNLYFTDPRYVGNEPRELDTQAVYRIDRQGNITELTRDVKKPNGIIISPDGRRIYVAEHDSGTDRIDPDAPAPAQGDMKIYAFPIDPQGGLGERQTLIDFGDKKGCDGMTVDQDGNLYLTVRDASRPGVLVVNPEGEEIAFIPTGPANQTGDSPRGLPSNVVFGLGDQRHVLYVTVDTSLYRIPLKSQGYHVQHAAP